ncbi:hypothetical protein [Companilactobacillus furfuricola]|uniref:hypothetical protein n=1 Tax=Companilactobacillus furfuricola TaxID=1462575 RepID=UPI0013DE5AA0|nr:hypothetical protein [Companilactobacillus furfuricola]
MKTNKLRLASFIFFIFTIVLFLIGYFTKQTTNTLLFSGFLMVLAGMTYYHIED